MFHRLRSWFFPLKEPVHVPNPTVEDFKVLLVPDRYHLKDVGKTKHGNGYWVSTQLSVSSDVRVDYVAGYVFDPNGSLILSDISVLPDGQTASRKQVGAAIDKVKAKIEADTTEPIQVRPFSVTYYGQTFGLVIRRDEDTDETPEIDDILVDALPGHTLMFYAPWQTCNYDT